MFFRIAAAILLVSTASAACHTYTPVRMDAVPAGATVRAHVDDATARELSELMGRQGPVPSLEGEVLSSEADLLALSVTVTMRELGARREALGQRVNLTRDQIVGLEARELDRTRTGIVAGVAAVGLTALAIRLFAGDTGASPGPGAPGPQELRVPLSWP